MMADKIRYATIKIEVRADEKEINTNELALSDLLDEVTTDLEDYLKAHWSGKFLYSATYE